ncbi:MAG: single-stranded-DNA-specific exonuclease RecJ [Clostridia bacterium]|nr:single-stranded-DNA-specific exonuclease RecJ [Clostridia bacterium]
MEQSELIELAKEFSIDKKLVEILIARGYDDKDKLYKFLYPSLDDLTDIHKYAGYSEVIERIKHAIDNKESILIYGDYDCDGVCGVSILYNYFKSIGIEAHCFLPNRHTDGYGLSIETLERLAEDYLSDLLITVDCGITGVEEVEYAREVLGFDVIVTDHHELGEVLPDCLIFNPKMSGDDCFRHLCGAGVALRIVEGLGGKQERDKYLDIAAIATIADVVPLVGDNRIIAQAGLKNINSLGVRRGIKKLLATCVEGEVSSYDIGFKIAPRINSLGRLSDANAVLDLFCSDDNFLLDSIVKQLNESNAKRMELTNDLADECFELLKKYDFETKPAIVLYNAYWDDGVLGIVASRITETFKRPTVLLTKSGEVYKGSGRSVKGIDIRKYVAMCEDLLIKFGGHTMACGLSLEEKNLQNFADRLNECIKNDFDVSYFLPKVRYDVDMAEVDSPLDMARGLKMLEPFGEGNLGVKFKETVFECDFMQMGNTSHVVSKRPDKEIVIFGGLKYKQLLSSSTQKDLYYSLSLANYKNRVYAQGKVSALTCDKVEEQGDLGAYLMTGIASGGSEIETIDCDKAIELGGKYSTCYIAYDISTYQDFLARYNEKCGYILTQNRVSSNLTPVTKLIFCPTSLKDLGYYKNVVLLDRPLDDGIFNKSLGKTSKLYKLDNNQILGKVKEFLPSYQRLGEIFIAIKRLLAEREICGMSELYSALSKYINAGYDEVVLSAVVLAELGILNISGKFSIDSSVKRKLAESKLYQKIQMA